MNSLHEPKYDDIYNQFYPKILQYCFHKVRHDTGIAEEITQEVFLNLYLSWDKLRSHTDDALLFSWLQRTARNLLSKYYRQLAKQSHIMSYDECIEQHHDIGEEDENFDKPRYTYEEYIEKIREFLPPDEFKLFTCIFIEGLTFVQTSELLNINLNTIKSRVRRLKEKLQNFILNFPD